MNKGILYKTKFYLAGHIEKAPSLADEINWRERFKEKVKPLGIIGISPLDKVFKNFHIQEGDLNKQLKEGIADGRYDWVREQTKIIIRRDLALVDKVDCVLAVLNPEIPSFGLIHELIVALDCNKPIFLVINGLGYRGCPVWLSGLLKKEWIYSSIDDVVEMLYKINRGEIELNNKYWRIFEEEFV